jgi:DNA-binding response OmpR family regulator
LQKIKTNPRFSKVPVIFLTAVAQEESIINAFDMGADDYIEKPFSVSILLRRMKAVLKRTEDKNPDKSVSIMKKGDLEVDFETYKVKISNQLLEMTLMEFNILKELIKADGRPLSRETLINRINGSTSVTERTIDVHICAIRKKLNTYGKTIETIRGVGYRLQL